MVNTSRHAIAIFDFDGTLTVKDSFLHFLVSVFGRWKVLLGLVFQSPVLLGYQLRLLSNEYAKEKLFGYFFKGWSVSDFQKTADRYADWQLSDILRKEAMEKLEWHKREGHRVVVVTASMEDWLRSWCLKTEVDLIGTKTASSEGRLTGQFSTKNCYGPQKVLRLKEKIELSAYKQIFVYGDSRGDRELLQLATHAFYRKYN
ncbi:MAG: HAD-IB family hydrolase [Acidobacteria bacterium]|nr:MAG: HAD-IB family hydrolase [Acidobacteriota bacterium]